MNKGAIGLLVGALACATTVISGVCACSTSGALRVPEGQAPVTAVSGLSKFTARHLEADRWLVRGVVIGSSGRESWIGSWDSRTDVFSVATKDSWDACTAKPIDLRKLRVQIASDAVFARENRVWIESLQTNEVRREAVVDMEWALRPAVMQWCQRVIVLGTSASRHRVIDKITIPPMATPHYYFSEPKTLRVQALSLPDLRSTGPVVELRDAQLTLPDRGSSNGCHDDTEMYSVEGFPGVLIVGGEREMWIVNLDRLNGGKP